MKNPQKSRYLYMMLSVFGGISLSILFFFALYRLEEVKRILGGIYDILEPFVYGGVIAYLLRPACNFYEDVLTSYLPVRFKKFAQALAVILSMLTGLLVVYALIIMIAPQLITSITNIWQTLPDRAALFTQWLIDTFGENEQLLALYNSTYETLYSTIDTWFKDTIMPQITNIVSGVGHSVLRVLQVLWNLVIGLIVAVYLLASRKKLAKQGTMLVRSTLNPRWAQIILNEIAFVDEMFGGFIDGKIIDSAIIGVICYVGCIVFKFPNALLVSAIVGITNVIPFFGPFIGAVPATLLIMLEDPIKGLWFIVFVFALQQLDGNVIGPKILGDRTGLASFWVLFAITLFGGMWGLVGMIVGVPVVAVIYDLIRKFVRRGLDKNNSMEYWDEYNRIYGEEKPIAPPVDPDENRGTEIP